MSSPHGSAGVQNFWSCPPYADLSEIEQPLVTQTSEPSRARNHSALRNPRTQPSQRARSARAARLALVVGIFASCFFDLGSAPAFAGSAPVSFSGKYYRGNGDVEHLKLLEISRRMFEPDPELQNLTMLYEPKWNGLVEGPTWDAWWVQNSYGTTYSILPFLREPFITFLQRSQDLWFDQMGDGRRVGAAPPFDWIAPDGCLCDAARPGWIVYKQGDGRTAIHDWGVEFTAAGVLLQSELLLISRDQRAIHHYLPLLERSARFIESRRESTNNLFLAGPAGNLLAPSYAGWRKSDGSFDKAYLAGLSVTWIAALDRLIELEKLAGRPEQARQFRQQRDTARTALHQLTTDEGYLIRSLDPDGTRHGVYGAGRYGYFEASPNHDAIAFRVVDDAQARRIYRMIASLPGLRPNDFVLPNYPSYDDMYEKPEGLWAYGTWVNGGHWSTCEARMILGYYRLGQFEDARRSMRRLLNFAFDFRMDNPLTQCGREVYQPNQPINLCYDTLGPAAAFMRGLFEYLYRADELVLVPHVPPGVTTLDQLDPVRFGPKQVLLSTVGSGAITSVFVNNRRWRNHDHLTVTLPFAKLPEVARIEIVFGNAKRLKHRSTMQGPSGTPVAYRSESAETAGVFHQHKTVLRDFERRMTMAGRSDSYEVAHANLALKCIEIVIVRAHLQETGLLRKLPQETRQSAADKAFMETATRLYDGLDRYLERSDIEPHTPDKTAIELWRDAKKEKAK